MSNSFPIKIKHFKCTFIFHLDFKGDLLTNYVLYENVGYKLNYHLFDFREKQIKVLQTMLHLVGIGLSSVSLVLNIIGLSIPYWFYDNTYNGTMATYGTYAGLWKTCMPSGNCFNWETHGGDRNNTGKYF